MKGFIGFLLGLVCLAASLFVLLTIVKGTWAASDAAVAALSGILAG